MKVYFFQLKTAAIIRINTKTSKTAPNTDWDRIKAGSEFSV
jgi:hypothetical protein